MNNTFLKDLLPEKVRQVLYVILFLTLLIWGIWEAHDGDWHTAVPAIIAALIPLLAAGNVGGDDGPPPPANLGAVPLAQIVAELQAREDANAQFGTPGTPAPEV
jgi:hypothetical protein